MLRISVSIAKCAILNRKKSIMILFSHTKSLMWNALAAQKASSILIDLQEEFKPLWNAVSPQLAATAYASRDLSSSDTADLYVCF